MLRKNKDSTMRLLSLCAIIVGMITAYLPTLYWLMPVCILLLQLYFFIYTDRITGYKKGSPRFKTFRFLIFFSACMIIGIYYMVMQQQETMLSTSKQSTIIIFIFMLVFGNYAPKIPFNRNLGIRLPWTLKDEYTWRYAHRIAGYTSIPCAFLYLSISLLGYYNLAGIMILVWILIPAIMSYRYAKERKETL